MVSLCPHRPVAGIALAALSLSGCHAAPSAPDAGAEAAEPAWDAARGYDPEWRARALPSRGRAKGPPGPSMAPLEGGAADLLGQPWTLAEAARGLPAGERWVATLTTKKGELTCELWPERAPLTVANFAGLANGARPWKSRRGVVREPAFDGALLRVQAGLLRAAPSPSADRGTPGYRLPEESWEGMKHDRAGLLCAGHDPAFDFLITTGPAAILDAPADAGTRPRFTVFGRCEPLALLRALAGEPERRGKPVTLEQVRVGRR